MLEEKSEQILPQKLPKILTLLLMVHGVVNIMIALPLFVTPAKFLRLVGWLVEDYTVARLLSAAFALVAVICFNSNSLKPHQACNSLLYLAVWDASVAAVIFIYLIEAEDDSPVGFPLVIMLFSAVFAVIWIYFRGVILRIVEEAKEASEHHLLS